MGIRKPYRELNSVDDIVRKPSPAARAREEYIHQERSAGCYFCGGRTRLAFYHRDPETKDFNVQHVQLRMSLEVLKAEIEKCVLICGSCKQRMIGPYKVPITIKDKELFYAMREKYSTQKEAKELPKRKTTGKSTKVQGNTRAQYSREISYTISKLVREAVFNRDARICAYCFAPATEIDHLVPWSYGGSDDIDNLISCCSVCNKIAHSMIFDTLEDKRAYIRKRRKLK